MTELNTFFFIINLFVALICGTLLPIIPVLTRKNFLFGVRVPPSAHRHDKAKALTRRYIFICIIGAALLLLLDIVQFIGRPNMTLLAVMYFPLLIVIIQLAAFIPNWRQAIRLKAENGWYLPDKAYAEIGTDYSRGDLNAVPWGYYIISLLLILANVAVALAQYPSLPDRIPTHFDIFMNPDAWSDKSIGWLLITPIINLFMLAMMAAVAVVVVRMRLQIDTMEPAKSFAQHRMYRRRMGHGNGICTLGVITGFVIISLMSIWPELGFHAGWTTAIMTIPSIPLIVIAIISGQGGCRLNPKMPEAITETYISTDASPSPPGRGDDRYWKLGLFYYNPDDPVFWVEDRFGSNTGMNYARTGAKVAVVALALLLIAGYAWLTAWLWPML